MDIFTKIYFTYKISSLFIQTGRAEKVSILMQTKAESDLNFNYPINCSVKSMIFRLISYSVYSPSMPEIRLIQHPICTNK